MSRNSEIFSRNLTAAMEERGISQADLARRMDTAWSTVNRWLNGSIPRKKTLEDLSACLGVASRWLASGDGPMMSVESNQKDASSENDQLESELDSMAILLIKLLPNLSADQLIETVSDLMDKKPHGWQKVSRIAVDLIKQRVTPLTQK